TNLPSGPVRMFLLNLGDSRTTIALGTGSPERLLTTEPDTVAVSWAAARPAVAMISISQTTRSVYFMEAPVKPETAFDTYEPVKGSARDIPAEPSPGWQFLRARSARPSPLCGPQRAQNSRLEPHNGLHVK